MRVLTVVKDLHLGGTQRVAQNYSIGYKNFGLASAVLAYYDGGYRQKRLKDEGIQVFVGGSQKFQISNAIREADNWNPDIIHIHNTGYTDHQSGNILHFLRKNNRKVIETNVFARVDFSKNRELVDLHLLLSKWCLWKWSMWSKYLYPRPIGVVLPNCIESTSFKKSTTKIKIDIKQKLKIPKNAFIFGRIGQPLMSKWSIDILRAFNKIVRENPNVYLLLIGAPEKLIQKVNKLNIFVRKRIINIPMLESDRDLVNYYSIIDTFVHSSQIGESFGMVLAEAMLCGCPVITVSRPLNDNSQIEVVSPPLGGYVLSNSNELYKTMCQFLNNERLRNRISRSAPISIKERYDIQIIMPKLIKIIDIIVNSKNRNQIRLKLDSLPEIVSQCQFFEIKEILSLTIGRKRPLTLIALRLIHFSPIYRLFIIVKKNYMRFLDCFTQRSYH